jgi:methylglutamate dehydrogenase subunit B
MLKIPCTFCGERDISEFSYGGRVTTLPKLDGDKGLQDWHEAVHMRPQTGEVVVENWFHEYGCENWISIQRNVKSHVITVIDSRSQMRMFE